MSLPGKKMKIGGWNYHVSDQGEGDKVVMLVHGMPDDGSCWKYQVPALLNAGYRVIVPDTLGYGLTDRPREVEHYKVEKIIDHMFEIIEKLGIKDHCCPVNRHKKGLNLGDLLQCKCSQTL